MAEKTGERIYNIPLRAKWVKQTGVQRTNRAVSHVKEFLTRHMHADKVKVSQKLNESLWKRGGQTPPSYVKVKARIEEGIVTARLPEEKEIEKVEEKKKPEGGIKGKLEQTLKAKAPQKAPSKENPKK